MAYIHVIDIYGLIVGKITVEGSNPSLSAKY